MNMKGDQTWSLILDKNFNDYTHAEIKKELHFSYYWVRKRTKNWNKTREMFGWLSEAARMSEKENLRNK
jgi:hypothetical protein